MKTITIPLVLAAVAIQIAGCGNDDDQKSGIDWSVGRGGEGCRDWQKAFCESQSRCAGVSIDACATQVQSIQCESDAVAADCAGRIPSDGCTNVPEGCMHNDVADGAWAAQKCDEFVAAVCSHQVTCGASPDVATCVTASQTSSKCSSAIGVKLEYDECLQAISRSACGVAYPPKCSSIIYVDTSSPTTG